MSENTDTRKIIVTDTAVELVKTEQEDVVNRIIIPLSYIQEVRIDDFHGRFWHGHENIKVVVTPEEATLIANKISVNKEPETKTRETPVPNASDNPGENPER